MSHVGWDPSHRSEPRTDSLARTTLIRPPMGNVCVKCGRRLVPSPLGRGGWVHENGLIRCEPPAAFDCAVCAAPALVQCHGEACQVMAHPGCLFTCTCCRNRFCEEHMDPAGQVCGSCMDRGEEPVDEEAMWS